MSDKTSKKRKKQQPDFTAPSIESEPVVALTVKLGDVIQVRLTAADAIWVTDVYPATMRSDKNYTVTVNDKVVRALEEGIIEVV